ncbi:aminoglycoside phosphotransferase [Rhodomicrobium vannielii ATCC 17100]|uniref:Aminoglycoside phosphotransferase n=1 Tax=Rhodomicrobium vannielii (strain ATCC 17100 / DSM 162 / LMG 4299 / NCIMB 10020 / ATH 3.1.1) TaxID=648757 RepID=E3HZ60_RHOVT|nr:phosphotransferase [Rhodomicrobium vannielii]ADP72107.1 aminoglycoside phosphotransferase [Rhodomicrobium vannielii ATCC 17100]
MAELIDIPEGHRFDEAKLRHYLKRHLPDFVGDPSIQQFQGGQSNPTFLITTASRKYVLRKQPPGKLLPSAHAIDREYRVQMALKDTPVPVVSMQLFCEDPSVIGTPFYVMDHYPGRIFADNKLPELNQNQRRAVYIAFAETLAAIHEVDFRALGLADFGRTDGYAARQLKRWTEQYAASKTGPNEAMDNLIAWLNANLPAEDEPALTHGDYRLDNVMFELDAPHVIAVLDWELSTLGNPLADLGYVCMAYRTPKDLPILKGLKGVDLNALGIPSEEEIVAAYCRRAGRDSVPDLTFFIALSFFRFAAIAQGVYARFLQGNAADKRAPLAEQAAQVLAQEGWKIAANAGN